MPIISIGKMQARYGLAENMPQLSAAELGWQIDSRRLFIGNGPTSEGAPSIGNTEVLTEYSDILSLAASYTYKGEAAGYAAQTGPAINSPVFRSLQAKVDEFASVHDFGAKGDGVTDDTAAINRALFEVFCRDDNVEVRRSLFIPAGIYLVSGEIKIPSYAYVYGDGKDCTIIRQTSAVPSCVARVADSLQQIDGNIGNNGAVLPTTIKVEGITFEQTTANDVFLINQANRISFNDVGFVGSLTTPSGVGTGLANIIISSSGIHKTSQITFTQCKVSNNTFGLLIDDDVDSVFFERCEWTTLYKAAKLGEDKTDIGPRGVHITNCYFNRIYAIAIHAYEVTDIYSSFNVFDDVGNQFTGIPAFSCITFENDKNGSISDVFFRSDADRALFPVLDTGGYSVLTVESGREIAHGRYGERPGVQISLANDVSSATTTGVTFSATTEKAVKIYYTAVRGSSTRHGTLTITASSGGATLSDEYQYDASDIGLTFSVAVSGSTTTLQYITSNTGATVSFTYKVELIKY